MPYDIPLLLLPLVGGYFILAKSIFFHHTYKRIGSQKLIFDSIIAGIILSLITWLIRKMFYFLTKEEYEKLSSNLGSLNYLLKK